MADQVPTELLNKTDESSKETPKTNKERMEFLESAVERLTHECADLRKRIISVESRPTLALAQSAKKMFFVKREKDARAHGFTRFEDAARFAAKNGVPADDITAKVVDEEGYPLDEEASSPRRRAVV